MIILMMLIVVTMIIFRLSPAPLPGLPERQAALRTCTCVSFGMLIVSSISSSSSSSSSSIVVVVVV